MAGSRTEKIGTVFSRVTALLKGNALQKENLPVWYEVYKAFPPRDEPIFGRPLPQKNIKKIFYAEDYIRAKLNKDAPTLTVNLRNNKVTPSQVFMDTYEKLLKDNLNEDEAYNKAFELVYKAATKE